VEADVTVSAIETGTGGLIDPIFKVSSRYWFTFIHSSAPEVYNNFHATRLYIPVS
jgi:hypothetical protein